MVGKYGIVYEAVMMDSSNKHVAMKRLEKHSMTQQDVKNVMVVNEWANIRFREKQRFCIVFVVIHILWDFNISGKTVPTSSWFRI